MQLFEVKNDIARITYNPYDNHLLPSDFLLIEDLNQKLIAQIINVGTTQDSVNNTADLKLVLSIDKEENLSYYSGYIPAKDSKIIYINPNEILELIKSTGENIYFGTLANKQNCIVKVPIDFIDDKLYIQADKQDIASIIIKNLVSELNSKNKKVIILDFENKYTSLNFAKHIHISKDFKLPLNINAFNTIYENDLTDCPLDDKALIQSIILELREYLKTLDDEFLPFTMFKNVVDDEFLQNPSSGLMLLRNKLWLYSQENFFAENKSQFDIFNEELKNQNIIVVDASNIEEKWFKFIIQTIISLTESNCYLITTLDYIKPDKKSLANFYNKKSIIPIISSSYAYEGAEILKSLCNNKIMCKSLTKKDSKEFYDILAEKMNVNEFILFGESTLYIPLILELQEFNEETAQEVLQTEIKQDVDNLLSTSKKIVPQNSQSLENSKDQTEDITTDTDLDFLDNLNNETETKISEPENEKPQEQEESKYNVFSPEQNTDDKLQDDILEDIGIDLTENETETNQTDEVNSLLENNTAENIIDEDIIDIDDLGLENTNDSSSEIEFLEEIQESAPSKIETINDIQENHTETNPEIIETTNNNTDDINALDILDELSLQENVPEENQINTQSSAENSEIAEILEDLPENSEEKKTELSNNVLDNTQNIRENAAAETVLEDLQEIQEENKQEPDKETSVENIDTVLDDLAQTENETKQNSEETSVENSESSDTSTVLDDLIDDITANKQKEETSAQKEQEKDKNEETPKKLTVYDTNKKTGVSEKDIPFKIGDRVYHPKHGKGVIEGFTNYSNKILFCQIEFEDVGRRILDPMVAGIEKI